MSVTIQSQGHNTETKESTRRKPVIIPPLNLNSDLKESPRKRTITSPHSARNLNSEEVIPPGSLVLTPHTPPGDDNPCEILNDKISQDIEKKLSGNA